MGPAYCKLRLRFQLSTGGGYTVYTDWHSQPCRVTASWSGAVTSLAEPGTPRPTLARRGSNQRTALPPERPPPPQPSSGAAIGWRQGCRCGAVPQHQWCHIKHSLQGESFPTLWFISISAFIVRKGLKLILWLTPPVPCCKRGWPLQPAKVS